MSSQRLTETGSAFDVRLLRAARSDMPPEGSEEKMLDVLRLGIATGVGGVAGVGGALVAKGLVRVVKILGAFGLASTIALGVRGIWMSDRAEPAQPARSAAMVTQTKELAPPRSLATDATDALAPQPIPAVPSARAPDARARVAAESEIALLARAKVHLQAGDARASLAALDEHARTYPLGRLAEEREVLRVDALLAAGGEQPAIAHATRFLAQYPRSAYAPRVREALFRTELARESR